MQHAKVFWADEGCGPGSVMRRGVSFWGGAAERSVACGTVGEGGCASEN